MRALWWPSCVLTRIYVRHHSTLLSLSRAHYRLNLLAWAAHTPNYLRT